MLLLPAQFYTFVIKVQRADGSISTIFRRYSEFNEFNSKLTAESTHKVPAFPSKIYVGRSAVRQVCFLLRGIKTERNLGRDCSGQPKLTVSFLARRSQVAEKRLKALNAFLDGVLAMPSTVSCSDIVYAFFHRTPRDIHDGLAQREVGF